MIKDTDDIQQPALDLPDNAAGEGAHGDIVESALNEGAEDALIEELGSAEGELSVDDLRRLPGAEEYSDEELLAEWTKAQAAVASGEGEEGEEAEEFKLPFPLFDEKGNAVEKVDDINFKDFLAGKYQIGYNANGKEQKKALADVIRVAQLGHYKESQFGVAQQERNQLFQDLTAATRQLDQANKDRKAWDHALTQFAQGNIEPMQKIATAYQQALAQMPADPQPNVEQERQFEEQGYQFMYQHVVPKAAEIAARYGVNAGEVTQAIVQLIQQEPVRFLTREKIDQIINYEMPALIEQAGHAPNGQQQTQQQPSNEVAALKEQLAAVQKTLAEQANARTQAVRDKSRRAPPVGGGSVPGAGDAMPALKNREDMKAWLRGEK